MIRLETISAGSSGITSTRLTGNVTGPKNCHQNCKIPGMSFLLKLLGFWLGQNRIDDDMGYFPNGTSGTLYEVEFCERCIHGNGKCAVWFAHMMRNYDECNNKDSILHMLIPLDKNGHNMKCLMFRDKASPKRVNPAQLDWAQKNGLA